MPKILVFSDSHGKGAGMRRAIMKNSDADAIFFLGDGISDIEPLVEEFPFFNWVVVRGNCDFSRTCLGNEVRRIEAVSIFGHNILAIHGDAVGVKGGLDELIMTCKQLGCDIALFGHTHVPHEQYLSDSGIYLFNPGSAGYERTFGIVTIEGSSVLLSHGKLLI